jgi:hypothetical protein
MDVYIYIYIYVYVFSYIHICKQTCMLKFIYMCVNSCLYMHMLYTHIYIYVCRYVYLPVKWFNMERIVQFCISQKTLKQFHKIVRQIILERVTQTKEMKC